MMKKGAKDPFRIALYGMDSHTSKTMEMYLKGPCRGVAVVVSEAEADIDMIDADHYKAKDLLETRRAATPKRPIILLSLENLKIDKTFFIKKPVNVARIEEVLAKIEAEAAPRKVVANTVKTAPLPPANIAIAKQAMAETPNRTLIDVYAKKSSNIKPAVHKEPQKAAKHQSAMQQNEGGFTAFLGTLSHIDFDDRVQLLSACYDPRHFFLAYVQSAYQTAYLQAKVLQLNSIWKSLFIFPESQKIWLDANDKQLQAFAGVAINKSTGNLALLTANMALTVDLSMDKFQDMQAFLWKLALWTSKGRFPVMLDIHHPVYMESWPNFTRLVITPDALRITALLIQAPKAPIEIARILNIKPQYVFVFLSACHTVGLLKQSERQADTVIAPEPKPEPKPATKTKNQGLLSKILSKLRGA